MNPSSEPTPANDEVQGEGDYKSARRYDEAAREFAESGKVEDAARNAKPTSEAEADDLRRAEREGKSHSKGEDPLLNDPARLRQK
jgi:hypothetical protein